MNAVNEMGDSGRITLDPEGGTSGGEKPQVLDGDSRLESSGEFFGGSGGDDGYNPSPAGNGEYPDLIRQSSGQSLSPKFTRRPGGGSTDNYDNMFLNDPRMNRIAISEAALRQDMFKECTFKPAIKPLPESYGAMKDSGQPFVARVLKWQKEKEAALQNKEKMLRSGQEAQCTFNPKINRNSDKAVKEIRGAQYTESANDRLYRNSDLYLQQRSQLINEVKEKEDELIQKQCTFKPDLVTKHTPIHQQVSSRFMHPQHSTSANAAASAVKDCTFTPKVNKVKPNMSSAKLYLSSNVVDRLTRPIAADDAEGDGTAAAGHGGVSRGGSVDGSAAGAEQMFDSSYDRPVMDMASFMGSLDRKGSFSTPGGVGAGAKPRAASARRGAAPMTAEEKQHRQEQFQAFLSRQNYVVKKKQEQIKQIERSQTPNFRPQISKRAQSLGSGRNGDGSTRARFIDRVDQEVKRRQASEQSAETKVSDPNCTFQPTLSKRAEKLRPRTTDEMSRGDLQRSESNRRKLKLEADLQQLSGATFQPELSQRARRTKSVLQLSQDPSQFLEWHKTSTLKKEQRRLELLREKEAKESEGCTFSPETRDCPAYVKRIAKSMSIVKAARNSTGSFLDPEANKPQWR